MLVLSLGSPNHHTGFQYLFFYDPPKVFVIIDISWFPSVFVLHDLLLWPLVTLQQQVQQYPIGYSFVKVTLVFFIWFFLFLSLPSLFINKFWYYLTHLLGSDSSPRLQKLTSFYHNSLLKGLNLRYMSCSQKQFYK